MISIDARAHAADGADTAGLVDAAASVLAKQGLVVIENLLDPELLARCREQVEREFPDMEAELERGYFKNSARRFTMPARIDGALADPAVYAHGVILDLCEHLIGDRFVLDSLGLLVSLPGAPQQKVHCDMGLFTERGIDHILPVYALSVAIPLIAMTEETGTTAFHLGTHRRPLREGDEEFHPYTSAGTVMVWDQRIQHFGTPNRSSRYRPVLFSTYCRHWATESVPLEATKYEKLLVSQREHARFDDRMRRVMARATVYD